MKEVSTRELLGLFFLSSLLASSIPGLFFGVLEVAGLSSLISTDWQKWAFGFLLVVGLAATALFEFWVEADKSGNRLRLRRRIVLWALVLTVSADAAWALAVGSAAWILAFGPLCLALLIAVIFLAAVSVCAIIFVPVLLLYLAKAFVWRMKMGRWPNRSEWSGWFWWLS